MQFLVCVDFNLCFFYAYSILQNVIKSTSDSNGALGVALVQLIEFYSALNGLLFGFIKENTVLQLQVRSTTDYLLSLYVLIVCFIVLFI